MSIAIIVLTISLAPAQKVLAYLDPGSGSFLIQLLIGGLVGGAVAVRAYWSRIRAFLNKGSETPVDEAHITDNEADAI
jgi:hypothetical protein